MRLTWRTLRDPVHFIALGLGTGLVPRAPGTAGSLLGLLPAWFAFDLPLTARIALCAAAFVVGIWICGESARRLGVHDHGGIVFDEIVGVFGTVLAVPSRSVLWFLLAFVFFRVFDILKPWPIRDMDHRLVGGAGIMLDDLMAAFYSAVCLLTIQIFLPTT